MHGFVYSYQSRLYLYGVIWLEDYIQELRWTGISENRDACIVKREKMGSKGRFGEVDQIL